MEEIYTSSTLMTMMHKSFAYLRKRIYQHLQKQICFINSTMDPSQCVYLVE